MKIVEIELNNFFNFKENLKLDFRYPIGHKKQGKPLDKICIIGQSGTGKTVLLNLLKYFISERISKNQLDFNKINNNLKITFDLEDANNTQVTKTKIINVDESEFHYAYGDFNEDELKNRWTTNAGSSKRLLINYPYDLIRKRDISQNNKDNSDQKLKGEQIFLNDPIIDFENVDIRESWKIMKTEVQDFCLREDNINRQKIEAIFEDEAHATDRLNELKQWRVDNKSPLSICAEQFLNPILCEFLLEVNQDFDLHDNTNNEFIKIKQINGDEIPFELLSTGTKHTLLFSISLFILKPQKTLILFDEPERSLHPQMQLFFIKHILSLLQNSQIIFATHSPTVASHFDPWEIVELKYDDNGKVFRKPYYDEAKGNHIDNYSIKPKFLRWDSIFKEMFGIILDGDDERQAAFLKLTELKGELLEFKKNNQLESEDAKNKLTEFEKIASDLRWNFPNETNK